MATKYDLIDPQCEKMKRLYNCRKLTTEDVQYLNYQFERYNYRKFNNVCVLCFGAFFFGALPIMKNTTATKYWSILLIGGFSSYQVLTHQSNQHIEQTIVPYFEKYKIK